ncbi:MAG: site-specific integrase [Sporichthyaceae bacterium]|nr:site-specific integrase [Sporichthyaceae bacterium]
MSKVRHGIVKRGSTWSYVVRVADPESGRTRPKWVGGFATEDEAKAARDEARVAARRGEYVDRSALTVREFLTEWIDGHAATVKPGTASGYRYDIEHYIVPRIGGLRLQSLRPAMLSRLYRELQESGGRDGGRLSASTVAHVHRTLRKALTDAVRVEQVLAVNPAERAKLPRVRRSEPGQVWTPAQLARFRERAAGHRLSFFFRLAAYTGARRGELLNLRWPDLDLDAAEVTFSGSTDVIDGERVEDTTKGDRSRVVSLDVGTVAAAREHRRRQLAERLQAGPYWTESGLIFTTELGTPVHPETPTLLMSKLIRDHNEPAIPGRGRGHPRTPLPPPADPLPRARLHDLRHIHATTLLLAGVPVHVVANRLGHADPSITLRVYAHVLREQTAGVADVFAKAVEAAVSKGVSK